MTKEIDTVPDFNYYSRDRYNYLKISDIPLDNELNALGYYKIHSNKFPNNTVEFSKKCFWTDYQTKMKKQIDLRNKHNELSVWVNNLEIAIPPKRKLFDGYPTGLYFAWEIGSISRRERASLGEKIDSVQDWFEEGKSSKKFSFYNPSTKNWLVFYFSKSNQKTIIKALEKLVEFKLIKEINDESFDRGVYGFGFQVSITYPHRLLGLVSLIVIGADEVKGKYSERDLEKARELWGGRSIKNIKEFPDQ